jgi:hypothetical protein
MNDSIKSIDERRILQVWPGSNGSLKIWEGISANISKINDTMRLNFTSEIQRPLSIEIMFKILNDLKVDNAEVHYDEGNNKTIISYPSFSGEAVIEWNEK